jgi:hypothetical protein
VCSLTELALIAAAIVFVQRSYNCAAGRSYGGPNALDRAIELDQPAIIESANHSDSSGLARSLALSFSRVAAALRIPLLPYVLQRNSGFLTRASLARLISSTPPRAVSIDELHRMLMTPFSR